MSPARSGLPALLPMGSPVASPQRKGTGQTLPFRPPRPPLGAALQDTSFAASAHPAWERGQGVLSEGPS